MISEAQPNSVIPDRTYFAARKVYNIHHIYLRIGDHLEEILMNYNWALIASSAAQDRDTVSRSTLVSAFQYAEALSDRLASEATLHRMDWKYALFLPINHPGISVISLCEFRHNLLGNTKGLQEFSNLLGYLASFGLFSKFSQTSHDPAHLLFTNCEITRCDRLKQTMQMVLSHLTSIAPEWMRAIAQPHWYERYRSRETDVAPTSNVPFDSVEDARMLGSDIARLLEALHQDGAPDLTGYLQIQHLICLWKSHDFKGDRDLQQRQLGCANCTCENLREP